ncbi:hypothetical protein J3P77_09595 [Pseudomonas sp. R1-18]|uniref:hypothetical protein n=1 Tax=Pseudomonas sp. R1-18 TaxID=1632772 RepID=UPI003DA842BA
MSEHFKNLMANTGFGPGTAEDQRQAAVAAALILIAAKVSNSPDRSTIVKEELERLSTYADQIQQALKVS